MQFNYFRNISEQRITTYKLYLFFLTDKFDEYHDKYVKIFPFLKKKK
jgi:hypothetical protein